MVGSGEGEEDIAAEEAAGGAGAGQSQWDAPREPLALRGAERGVGGRSSTGYRMPLWPLPPIVVIALMAYVTYQLAMSALSQLLVAVATVVVGIVYYYGFIHPRRNERWLLADPITEDDEGKSARLPE